MALKRFNPTTASLRHTILIDRSELSDVRPEKSLTVNLRSLAGRNVRGKITVRHKGGRGRRQYRLIDFKRDKHNVSAVIETVEYDPNRSAFIALLKYADGERRYILCPDKLKVGDTVVAGPEAPIRDGNALPLKNIPQGSTVHAVQTTLGAAAIFARSAGTSVQIQGFDKGYAQLKMPSGEVRLVREECYATIGSVSNAENKNVKLGKAGRSRHKGIRPGVRGVAMSYKHPHGSGQGKKGKATIGGVAKDLWGNRVGARTRKNKQTNKYIVRRRTVKSGRKFKKYKTII